MPHDKKSLRKRLSLAQGTSESLIDGPPATVHSDSEPSVAYSPPSSPSFSSASFSIRSFAHSVPGKTPFVSQKTNQDSYATYNNHERRIHIYSVFDGHGNNGHLVSQKVSSLLAPAFLSLYTPQIQALDSRGQLAARVVESLGPLLDEKLLACATNFDSFRSGSTMVACFFISDAFLITANIGDSRAILFDRDRKDGAEEDGAIVALSFDHKPDLPAERQRILQSGGRVAKNLEFDSDDEAEEGMDEWENAPYRVWLPKEDVPGLAMSRALGDYMVKKIGVINQPTIDRREIKEGEKKRLFIASDGVWEFLDAAEVVKACRGESGGIAAETKKVVQLSEEKWTEYSCGDVMDDITAVIVEFSKGKQGEGVGVADKESVE